MTDTRIWLTNSLTSLLQVEPGQVVDHARLVEELGADSLDVVEITMAIEDQFRVKIEDDESADVRRVDQLLALIDRKVAKT